MSDRKFGVIILHILFAAIVLWWLALMTRDVRDGTETYLFNLVYALLGFYGGILAILRSREWGWGSSLYGKTLLFLGVGVIFWSIGGLIWAYYNFAGISDVPYPSLADHLGFAWFYPFSLLALFNLVSALGFHLAWKQSGKAKFVLIAIPIICTAITFYIYSGLRADSSLLLAFYKYFYNLFGGLLFATSITIMFLAKYFSGGKLRIPILLLVFGIAVQYLADVTFTYRADPDVATYFNGDFTDMLYATSLYLVSLGSAQFTLKK